MGSVCICVYVCVYTRIPACFFRTSVFRNVIGRFECEHSRNRFFFFFSNFSSQNYSFVHSRWYIFDHLVCFVSGTVDGDGCLPGFFAWPPRATAPVCFTARSFPARSALDCISTPAIRNNRCHRLVAIKIDHRASSRLVFEQLITFYTIKRSPPPSLLDTNAMARNYHRGCPSNGNEKYGRPSPLLSAASALWCRGRGEGVTRDNRRWRARVHLASGAEREIGRLAREGKNYY